MVVMVKVPDVGVLGILFERNRIAIGDINGAAKCLPEQNTNDALGGATLPGCPEGVFCNSEDSKNPHTPATPR